jgi:glycine/sarcosine N-methyltransferase
MLAKAFENARGRDHILRTVQADWRWLNRDVHDYYDAVICLGRLAPNSSAVIFSWR